MEAAKEVKAMAGGCNVGKGQGAVLKASWAWAPVCVFTFLLRIFCPSLCNACENCAGCLYMHCFGHAW